ncbi:hypothetical protein [Amphibacillus indicireducens]|uniref:Glycine zipper-like domain-containing protein n=1 Tax=Amphibacillus indicireducens TaxID=1076330 RepID=A0ABP7W676_9BACI
MGNTRADELKLKLNELSNSIEPKLSKQLDLEKCERNINRLAEFSSECDACLQNFSDFENHLSQLLNQKESINKQDIKTHTKVIRQIETHLTDQHDLVSSGHYTGIYMSIGLSIGLLFGLVIFDNIGFGLPIGLAIGLAIGAGKDEEAKKKGKVI